MTPVSPQAPQDRVRPDIAQTAPPPAEHSEASPKIIVSDEAEDPPRPPVQADSPPEAPGVELRQQIRREPESSRRTSVAPEGPADPVKAPQQEAPPTPTAARSNARAMESAASPEASSASAPGAREPALLPGKPPIAFGARLVSAKQRVEPIASGSGAETARQKFTAQHDEIEEPATPKARAPRTAAEDAPEQHAAPDRDGTSPPAQHPNEVRASQESEPAAPRKSEQTSQTPRSAAAPDPPKPPAVARDIKLELSGSTEHKVEVRLVERGGEVHLAVRTPDDRLAGEMREHLPLLSSRLEQSGFRADGWHAAGPTGSERRLEVDSSSAQSGDTRERGERHSRGDRDDTEQQRPHSLEDPPRKKKGTPFEWLMSSLR
jgi:hypothetical protein